MKQADAARDNDSPGTMSWQSLEGKMATIITTRDVDIEYTHVILVSCVPLETLPTGGHHGKIRLSGSY